ncbi:hypothetical protein NDU88_003437 [Pleurodeles waltl]|uniref:Uncharacterized protein n=1 Tax=Pleurodeles waltl TaxID=8319 RepID=A0AAV7W5C3_PLEWA|nr:hypothetical protein NDU88_003437 [Pleurodeles waltl]
MNQKDDPTLENMWEQVVPETQEKGNAFKRVREDASRFDSRINTFPAFLLPNEPGTLYNGVRYGTSTRIRVSCPQWCEVFPEREFNAHVNIEDGPKANVCNYLNSNSIVSKRVH